MRPAGVRRLSAGFGTGYVKRRRRAGWPDSCGHYMKVLIDGRRFESALLRHTDRYTSALITHLAQRGLAVYLRYDASTVASVATLQTANIGNLHVRDRVGFIREQI